VAGFVNSVIPVGYFNSGEIFDEVQKSKWWRQMFCCRLTYNADRSRYCYFLFNQEGTKDRNYVDQCIL